ncbi:MAG: hypothetical protein K5666_00560, partial [Bacilli bacterium]|nr:hypothetical protein [Bacilli bacterium]
NKLEYLPMDAYNNKFYIATRSREIIALEGKAIIESTDTGDYTIKAKVQTFDEVTLLELPYIYYPGYIVKGDGVTMQAFETRNGFLGVELPKNDTINLEVSYSDTSEIKLAKGISIAFAVLFLGYCGFEIFKKKYKINSEP